VLLMLLGTGCAGDVDASGEASPRGPDTGGFAPPGGDAGTSSDTGFVPEQEEFLVREVAATDTFVFVPNSSEESNTVARIDGRDLSVEPIQVADRPVAVRAAQVDLAGNTQDVAYVLCDGASVVAVVRNPQGASPRVSLLPVPSETNAIRLAPGGQHLLAYIDPDQPLPSDTGVASLQSLAVVELGATPAEDTVHQLSVTPEISEIEFTADGSDAFVVGRDGINHLALDEIDGDAFVPPIGIELSDSAFPPADREVEVSDDGTLLVVRSSAGAGLALYRRSDDGQSEAANGNLKIIDLPGRPTDITLTTLPDGEGGQRRIVVAPIRETGQVALVDVDAAYDASPTPASDNSSSGTPGYVELLDIERVEPGLARLTPDRRTALLYTTTGVEPYLGVLDLEQRSMTSYALRNQIRAVSITPTGASAVVIHRKQQGAPSSPDDPADFFRHNHGVTLVDLATGYLRPVTLDGEPIDWLMTPDSEGTHSLYAILTPPDNVDADDPAAEQARGLLKLNMQSFRRDFVRTARTPAQLGRVADKVFVSQEAGRGRITFVDVDTGDTRTVSGYQLNAGIQ
jgi:hypothetical protein